MCLQRVKLVYRQYQTASIAVRQAAAGNNSASLVMASTCCLPICSVTVCNRFSYVISVTAFLQLLLDEIVFYPELVHILVKLYVAVGPGGGEEMTNMITVKIGRTIRQ